MLLMKSTTALIERFKKSLNDIPVVTRNLVNRPGGLSENKLLDLILSPKDYGVNFPQVPHEDVVVTSWDVEKCAEVGNEAIFRGEVAYCLMAGGAGTRIGEPKALLRVPGVDMSLLTLKLFQAHGTGPIWVVVSPRLKDRIVDHVSAQVGFDSSRIRFVEQYESYRLEPDNQISFVNGEPDLYPCGHGDLFPALVSSNFLGDFLEKGGKYVCVVNVDNVAASLDPVAIGRHIISSANVSCEVIQRNAEDSGGMLCEVEGSYQILESFKIRGVDPRSFKWLNTNTFIFNANLNISPLGEAWNRVQKNVGGRLIIQHERLLQEITEAYDTIYFGVERSERFMPIKNTSDLELVGELLNANSRLL